MLARAVPSCLLPLLVATALLAGCAHSGGVTPTAGPTKDGATASTAKGSAAATEAPPAVPVPAQRAPERVEADAPRATAAGTTFTVPAGWTLTTRGGTSVLEPPEPDTHVVLVEGGGPDAAGAVAAAWAAYAPGFSRKVELVAPRPARMGWDEVQVFTYETSPNERRTVQAVARRKGTAWTVLLVDGSDATLEKRASPMGLVVQSTRPAGYARESFAGKTAHPLDAARVQALVDFVKAGMETLKIPGVGLAILDHGDVVWEGGLGVRELGKPEPVDKDTLFLAASNTKGMTTLLLARLVDEGRLRWDEPVVEAYPRFRLSDPDVTRQVLVKHLICACTGLPRQDLEWLFEYSGARAQTTFDLLSQVKPTSKFGEVFQYSNLLASAAGYIAGHARHPELELGRAYDLAMREGIFAPLGMERTTFDIKRVLATNHAWPHGEDADGTTGPIDFDIEYSIVPHRPAGGVWTSAHDFARYARLELSRGLLPDGTRLVSESAVLARRAPQIALGEDASYGMGIMVDRTYGVDVVHHGGDMPGYHSDFYVVPGANAGVALLTNGDNGPLLRRAVMRRLLELLYDGRPEAEGDVAAQAARHEAERRQTRARLTIPPDPARVAELADAYRSPELGRLRVVKRKERTIVDVGEWRTAVASRRNEDGTTSFHAIDPGFDGFEFVVAERDGARALIVRDGQHEYVFREEGRRRRARR